MRAQQRTVDLPRAVGGHSLQKYDAVRQHILRQALPQAAQQPLRVVLLRLTEEHDALVRRVMQAAGVLHLGQGVGRDLDLAELDAVPHVLDLGVRAADKEQIAVFHINDSKNIRGASKDRHANIGLGEIGFDALSYIVHHKDFKTVPKILETPYIPSTENPKKSFAPYKHEIEMLKTKTFSSIL